MDKVFVPHELKTIEVDTGKKIFKINGEDFGRRCTGFSITCHSYKDFDIHMEVDATVRFVTIRDGKCVSDIERVSKDPWFSDRPKHSDDGK